MHRSFNLGISRLLSGAFVVFGILAVCAANEVAHAQTQIGATQAGTPIPEGDIVGLEKQVGLIESQKTAKEMTPGWRKPKVLLVATDEPSRLAWLQEAVPDVKLIHAPSTPSCRDSGCKPVAIDWAAVPGIADADGIIGVRCSEALLSAAKNLRWFHSRSAGVDEDFEPCPELLSGKYLLTDGQKLYVGDIAGNAVAFMVSLMRCVDLFVHMDADRRDKRPNFGERGWNIGGRTVLVAGLGGVGTQVAKMSHGLGMKVIATRETSHEGPDYVDYVGLSAELPALIGTADVVVVTAPLTPETKQLFNAAMFARMKRGSLFINVARGEEVVQPDLIAALKDGQLGGAAMDVTDPDPLPDGDPLFSAPNIIVATHHGAPSHPAVGEETSGEKGWLVVREEMRRYAAGEKMLSVVDVTRGY